MGDIQKEGGEERQGSPKCFEEEKEVARRAVVFASLFSKRQVLNVRLSVVSILPSPSVSVLVIGMLPGIIPRARTEDDAFLNDLNISKKKVERKKKKRRRKIKKMKRIKKKTRDQQN